MRGIKSDTEQVNIEVLFGVIESGERKGRRGIGRDCVRNERFEKQSGEENMLIKD